MSEDEPQLLSGEDVAQLLEMAWLAMYDAPFDRAIVADIERPEMVCASISIGGPRNVAIQLNCAPALARSYARAVLGSDYRESNDDDVCDVLGELANVIGGNYKGAISDSDEWTLSLPVVTYTPQELPRGKVTAQVSFLCEGDLIECLVVERA